MQWETERQYSSSFEPSFCTSIDMEVLLVDISGYVGTNCAINKLLIMWEL